MINNHELQKNIEQGQPTTDIIDEVVSQEIKTYIMCAEEAALIAHTSLYDAYADSDPRIVTFTDSVSEPDKYISFMDSDGRPLFGPWNPEQPASDIGIRGANPSYEGVVNPTTVIHADTMALDEYKRNGAPSEVVYAIAMTARLNEYVEEYVAKPYLTAVARSFDVDPRAYLEHFFATERGRREQILTRVIMYHAVASPGQRPSGTDGEPLLIKEHVDKSSWTIDIHQSTPGLQHRVGKKWHDASTDIAAFRGTADSYLPVTLPATLHRAVMRDHEPPDHLRRVGIGRIAVPMFISPIHEGARVVQSNSAETHPTEYN